MNASNPVLKSIMRFVYEKRSPLAIEPQTVVRHEISDGHSMCEVWFMTEGCSYDRDGGCTMCNYGKGHIVDPSTILAQLKIAFQQLPKAGYNLVVNPSGSFMDEHEVSEALRRGIYCLLDDISFESLTIESRADVISCLALEELRNRYPQKRVSVEIGVETFNPWLLRNSINKGVTITQILDAVNMVHNAGLTAIANIGIGLPFINERTNISTAVYSIVKAFELGFDAVILFPYHVKPWSLLETLYSRGEYQCISLWAVVAVLLALSVDYLPRVNISWYRNYYTDKSKILSSPGTCPDCKEQVLESLDKYKAIPSFDMLSEITAAKCPCRTKWDERLHDQKEGIDFGYVEQQYRRLAMQFSVDSEVIENTIKEMRDTFYADH
jgi:radical SAM enzyme (TIGR01210 family)